MAKTGKKAGKPAQAAAKATAVKNTPTKKPAKVCLRSRDRPDKLYYRQKLRSRLYCLNNALGILNTCRT